MTKRGEISLQCHHAMQFLSAAAIRPSFMPLPQQNRPAWLNWLILLAFLWSSWQLAGFWLERLHG
ncbi:MAG: hypothetical protein ACKO0M_09620 [Cyanobium sp.]